MQAVGAGNGFPLGGRRARAGVDCNQNCMLDDNEVQSIAWLCAADPNSANGTFATDVVREPAGNHCPTGGLRVRAGVDHSGDGTLGDDEVEAVSYQCHDVVGAGVLVHPIEAQAADASCTGGGAACTPASTPAATAPSITPRSAT